MGEELLLAVDPGRALADGDAVHGHHELAPVVGALEDAHRGDEPLPVVADRVVGAGARARQRRGPPQGEERRAGPEQGRDRQGAEDHPPVEPPLARGQQRAGGRGEVREHQHRDPALHPEPGEEDEPAGDRAQDVPGRVRAVHLAEPGGERVEVADPDPRRERERRADERRGHEHDEEAHRELPRDRADAPGLERGEPGGRVREDDADERDRRERRRRDGDLQPAEGAPRVAAAGPPRAGRASSRARCRRGTTRASSRRRTWTCPSTRTSIRAQMTSSDRDANPESAIAARSQASRGPAAVTTAAGTGAGAGGPPRAAGRAPRQEQGGGARPRRSRPPRATAWGGRRPRG